MPAVLLRYLGLLLCLTALSAGAQTSRHLLVLYSYHAHLPWTEQFDQGLQHALKASPMPWVVHHEYLDRDRLNERPASFWLDYLDSKYQGVPLDGLIAESEYAARLVQENRQAFSARHVVYVTEQRLELPPGDTQVPLWEAKHVENTLLRSIQQIPDLKTVVVIDSDDATSRVNYARLHAVAGNYPTLRVERWFDFEFSELFQRSAHLEKDSVILYNLVFQDRLGQFMTPRAVLTQLAETSPVPIYTFYTSLLETGTAGGHMLDTQRIASAALQQLNQHFEEMDHAEPVALSHDYFDLAVLQEYGISTAALPDQYIALNPPPSLWDQYRDLLTVLIFAAGLLCLLALGLCLWLWRRQQRLHASHQSLNAANTALTTLTRTDPLTGLLNRRAMMDLLDTIPPAREGRAHYLLLIDLDHFKAINDHHGHGEGDRVLIHVARCLQETLRQADPIARWGGEEFLVVVQQIDLPQARYIAEKLRKSINYLKFENLGRISASLGVAQIDQERPLDSSLEHADKALYRAKRAGRNRVRFWEQKNSEDNAILASIS